MTRPLCLDLFCGAGGASMGYYRAGYDVIGVDNRRQPRYPFPMIRADAPEFLASARLGRFDLIHASPPCQAFSAATPADRRSRHPNLIEPVRQLLQDCGVPFVIENVPGAPLRGPLMLCGMMFGLRVFRHRIFEISRLVLAPYHAGHGPERIGRGGFCTVAGGGNSGLRDRTGGKMIRRRPEDGVNGWRKAMEIDWMTRDELAQAIPPAYTQWLGEQLR